MTTNPKPCWPPWSGIIVILLTILLSPLHSRADETIKKPVIIGFDAEQGNLTSTSDDAIRIGILTAIHEINAAGGVLGGRPLELVVKDNRSVPARGIRNIEEFAEIPDLVAVMTGKFSPVVLDEIPVVHGKKIILLDPWAAADPIIENGQNPNYIFRLSLTDSWAIATMLNYAVKKGAKKLAVLLPTTGWGRSCEKAIQAFLLTHPELTITTTQWYMWGSKFLTDKYDVARKSGAEVIILVANEVEGSILVQEIAALPLDQRLPVISHWGVAGGDFPRMCGDALNQIDFTVVQSYSFFDNRREQKLRQFYQTAGQLFNINTARDVFSPVGVAHAYDLTHILALAINQAGTTERSLIRDALEQLQNYDGLIKNYPRPFTPDRHEALEADDIFMCRFQGNGDILRIKE
ncbi:MAG: ABC transporter substrate-binding protein [Desulfobulbaceae bacterium]|nr:ABC transporter substrate-binding protein [Desulfobulbaceae bacterium]